MYDMVKKHITGCEREEIGDDTLNTESCFKTDPNTKQLDHFFTYKEHWSKIFDTHIIVDGKLSNHIAIKLVLRIAETDKNWPNSILEERKRKAFISTSPNCEIKRLDKITMTRRFMTRCPLTRRSQPPHMTTS